MTLPETMQALQLSKVGHLDLVRIPVPRPNPDELLIKTAATTICTSDLIDMKENPFDIPLPRVLGHEAAGDVVAVGDDARGFSLGRKVTAHPVIPCGFCVNCERGLGHLCTDMGHLGIDRDGTFAEFFCIRADRARPVPKGMDMAVAGLIEPVAVCLESISRARVAEGETILIAGDGPFGIMTARLAIERQPKKIILIGLHGFRLRHVPEAVCIHPERTPDVLKAVMDETGCVGVDAAFLCASVQELQDLCVASLRARGRLSVFSPIGSPTTVDMFRVHVKELDILGACNDEDRQDEALMHLANPELGLDTIVTHRIDFSQWEEAFRLASTCKDEALKVAMVFGETS